MRVFESCEFASIFGRMRKKRLNANIKSPLQKGHPFHTKWKLINLIWKLLFKFEVSGERWMERLFVMGAPECWQAYRDSCLNWVLLLFMLAFSPNIEWRRGEWRRRRSTGDGLIKISVDYEIFMLVQHPWTVLRDVDGSASWGKI